MTERLVLRAAWNEPVQAGQHFKNVLAPWCKLIVAVCERLDIPAHGISPLGKGQKMAADRFERITGWTGRSNQHERDGAMVAWPFRRSQGGSHA